VTEYVGSDEDLYAAIRQARAPVGLKIPYDYAERLAQGRNVTLQLLVDGSDSTVSGAAVNAFNGLMLVENQRLMGNLQLVGAVTRPILDGRPVVLYNPATRSPNFFIPGMVAVLPQIMVILLVAMAIVRERERGTLEQLRMTPVEPLGVMVGKALPYFLLGFGEVCLILTMMRIVFSVPVNGNVGLLLLLTIPQLAAILGLGLVISTRAGTQAEAFQMTMGTMLPSIFLSGYIFPINNMPLTFQVVSQVIPTTHYINITRGVILRGAGFWDLWPSAAVLCVMGIVLIAIAARRFQKGV
jgi:ABC-2 type transport system permease protein